ncbi:hypothetical protein PFDSM3638_02180 [Pyrococcus furiosus DSM 3638]|uniref:Uncharacterized protein n=2 Tax=Pyrococcus furiosus TaxID=2261 RepID=A0A5C0XML7_PYRFU|nr:MULTISPECIES: hypothetical protein [Pyrococcus]AFN03233.1 hypothetical protein PFC_01310 [Pyrococcus furiosus COM1]MDK2869070.1 hypothetical protein [Pyrococcus sp.]QEK78153.1 hypothetical protein PFDSM3638_02180 [Pyrococcus furiosus DSM 3638]
MEFYENVLGLYSYLDVLSGTLNFYFFSGGYLKLIYESLGGGIASEIYKMLYNTAIFDIIKLISGEPLEPDLALIG